MRCRNCEADGITSRLNEKRVEVPPGDVEIYYAEDGKKHVHDHTVYKTLYQCSNGHAYVVESLSRCPQPGCPYGREPQVIS